MATDGFLSEMRIGKNKMGKCCSKPKPPVQERIVQIDNKVFNQDVLVRKGMKSGAQVGRTDDGDFEAGFQIMFQKRNI